MKTNCFCGTVSIASVLLAHFVSAAQPSNNGILLRECVVVFPERNEIYISTPDTSVQALSLRSGQSLWTSRLKGKPLVIMHGELIVQATNAPATDLVIANVDIMKKGQVKTRNSLQLPGTAKSKLAETANNKFHLWATVINGELNFYWDFQQIPVKGMVEKERESSPNQSGAFKMTKDTKKLNAIEKSSAIENIGNQTILADGDKRIAGADGKQFISRDQRTILLSEKTATDTTFNAYRWQLFDASSKARIAELYQPLSYAPFIVSDNLLIIESGPHIRVVNNKLVERPLQIVAIDLTNMREVYRKDILDTVYRGPTPP